MAVDEPIEDPRSVILDLIETLGLKKNQPIGEEDFVQTWKPFSQRRRKSIKAKDENGHNIKRKNKKIVSAVKVGMKLKKAMVRRGRRDSSVEIITPIRRSTRARLSVVPAVLGYSK